MKACCGAIPLGKPWAGLSRHEQSLLSTVLAIDEEGFQAGRSPAQRAFDTVLKSVERLHPGRVIIMSGAASDRDADEINNLVKKLYRPDDIGMGGMHVGAFMFRDIFARVDVPFAYGEVAFNPLDLTDLTATQKDWLRSRPEDFESLCDQFIDLFDFGYGLDELGSARTIPEPATTMMGLAAFQLQAAASTLLTAFDRRGAVQAALLAVELALKSGLITNGLSTEELRDPKKFGHHHAKLAEALATFEPKFDRARSLATIDRFPAFVPNRYSPDQPTRVEAGHIVMGAQYIAAEVMRQLGDRDLRVTGGMSSARVYPPL